MSGIYKRESGSKCRVSIRGGISRKMRITLGKKGDDVPVDGPLVGWKRAKEDPSGE